MKRKILLCAISLILMISAAPKADGEETKPFFTDGNTYNQDCLSTDSGVINLACISYVDGLSDGMGFIKSAFLLVAGVNPVDSGPGSCSPDGVTYKQNVDVLRNYIKNHPENRQEPLALLAAKAWIEAWPCKNHAELTTVEQCAKSQVQKHSKDICLGSLCFYLKEAAK